LAGWEKIEVPFQRPSAGTNGFAVLPRPCSAVKGCGLSYVSLPLFVRRGSGLGGSAELLRSFAWRAIRKGGVGKWTVTGRGDKAKASTMCLAGTKL
jgi:hypothetical protein